MSLPVSPVSQFGSFSQIMQDLFGNGVNTNKEDTTIKNLIVRYNYILQNKLRPYADTLPMALNTITGDLNQACNLLVEMEWHRLKTHWDDVRTAKQSFDVVWESIVEYLKNVPTQRTQPVSVVGNLASSSTLLQNIPNLTDASGNILPGF